MPPTAAAAGNASLDSPYVEKTRSLFGGQLIPPPVTQVEWYLGDIDDAAVALDGGDFSAAAKLVRALRRDPVISGLQATKVGGVTRLPKRWRGHAETVAALTGTSGVRPVFDELCPLTEVEALANDADSLGAGVAILDEVPGRDYPVMTRLEPENLWYLWPAARWYYRSLAGMLPITPGDGRWVLHLAGPRVAPWQAGNWHALGRAWVRKEHALASKDNWLASLANAARIAIAPQGSSETDRYQHFRNVVNWAWNTVFSITPGWDVKILESNGRGWEGFDSTIKACNEEYMIQLVGQLVSVQGGSGFSTEDLYATVRFDLIQKLADPLAVTLSTQVVPYFALRRFGPDALLDAASFQYEVVKPGEKAAEGAVYGALGSGIKQLDEALRPHSRTVDVDTELRKFRVSTVVLEDMPVETSKILLTPSGAETTIRGAEARRAQGLEPFGDERDDLTIPALAALVRAASTSETPPPAGGTP